MKKIILIILFIIFAGAQNLAPVRAQNLVPLHAQETNKFNLDEIKLKCDSFQMDDKNKVLMMKNCTIEGRDIIVKAPFSRYNTKDQTGLFSGGVRVTSKDSVITADRLQLFYAKKEIILEGNVVLTTTKVSTTASAAKEKYILKCNRFDYFWEKEEGTAYGNVHIIQKDAQAFCDQVFYSKKSNMAHMTGNVRFLRRTGDFITAQEAWIDLEKETFIADKDVEGRFYIQTQKEAPAQGESKPDLKEIELKPQPVEVI